MIAQLEAYPDYQPGLPWTGDLPSHWDLKRGKGLFEKMARPVRPEDETVTCFRDGIVTLRKNRRLRGFTESLKEIGYQGIRKGDLVIHAMDAFAGAAGVSDSDGKSTPVYSVCRPRTTANSAYYGYLVRQMARSQWILALAKGIRERSTDFRFEAFGGQYLPVPPPDEQAAIVRFLAEADRRINRLIRSKRRLIELLNEQKQAIITQAVTRGLDPDVPMNDTGLPWCPQIPLSWKLESNRGLFKLNKQVVGDRHREYTLLSLTKRGIIARDMENPEGKFPASFDTYQVVEPGDFVFCLFDIDETPRAVGLSELHGMITGAYTRFQSRRPDLSRYIYYYYLAMDSRKLLKPLYTGLRKVIQKNVFLSAKTPVPPCDEAHAIVQTIDGECKRIDDAVAKATDELRLIGEYRARLVADVVTGKLDVRVAAADLPDPADAEQAEAIEDLEDTEDESSVLEEVS